MPVIAVATAKIFFLYLPLLGWLVIYPQYYHVEKAGAPNSNPHMFAGGQYP